MQFGNNCTHNSLNCTQLRLVQLLDCYWYDYILELHSMCVITYTENINFDGDKLQKYVAGKVWQCDYLAS